MSKNRAYLLAIFAAFCCTSRSAELVSENGTTRLKTEFEVLAETPTLQTQLQLSSDLRDWTGVPLNFDPTESKWSIDADSPIAVLNANERSEGIWGVEFELSLSTSTFLRLVRIVGPFPADSSVTEETRNLLKNLHRIGWDPDHYAFGQEFPLSFSYPDNIGNGSIDQSDSKDVVGDHPGVHGSDFLYMIDQPWHEDFHIAAAKRAYESGAIVTFDYHWPGKYGGGYQAHPEDDNILDYVVRNDDSRGDVTWFYESLDRLLLLVNEELRFPIVFRPFHEMDGNWFWWGRQMEGGAETYRKAYQLLVEYLSARTEYLLYCWSPDVALADFEQFYPGDEYVDVIGRDIYNVTDSGRPIGKLVETIAFAEEHGKVAAFTETGFANGGGSFEDNDPDWWTTHILDPIAEDADAGKIAWVLTWINATWSGPYIPHKDSPQAAKEDFIQFYEADATLFQKEIAELNMYAPPPEI